ncbi:phospholipase D-like domain-containing protein [Salipaludibacillus daqingensis]|uniref:phospholipase D-like domain-containing protein n=1 Tax=Salipaludibacillus daqingensis TaxID=3041001 RepID=UPI002472EC34|nr:phospholipase D-like domain-containing protein [Salipaludibacillus daqingensis]
MKKRHLILISFLLIYVSVIAYHQLKDVPEGVSYSGDMHSLAEEDVSFIYDLTYEQDGEEIYEHSIFDEVFSLIEEAEEFLIVDMFMINESSDESRDFPSLSADFSAKIKQQMEDNPDLNVIIITDHVNTTYRSHEAEHIDPLADLGAEVIYTDLTELRDPNLLYSGIWRMFFQWFGQSGTGWLPNALGSTSPDVTFRSYLKVMNLKANHRKAVISENSGMYLSANAHDASAYHSNIAFRVTGPILQDMIEVEKAVSAFSGGDDSLFPTNISASEDTSNEGPIQAQVVTEREIEHAIIDALDQAMEEDDVWIGMFYLSDRHIIEAIEQAADRGVNVRLILDPNENAFGQEKIGLPNIPVASELLNRDDNNIQIRWYNVNEEQYHSKMIYVRRGDESQVIGGSTNYTSRNLDDYNLENNLNFIAPNNSEFIEEVDDYFTRIWQNDDAEYTVDYDTYGDSLSSARYVLYFMQKTLRMTTY